MYQSIGHHPKSTYMTADGYALHNDSGLDLIIDIAGVYFPLLTLTYTMTHTVEPQHQTGMHGPVALINTIMMDLEHSHMLASWSKETIPRPPKRL